MSNPEKAPPSGDSNWEGFREIDRAIAENRLTSYTGRRRGPTHGGKSANLITVFLALGFVDLCRHIRRAHLTYHFFTSSAASSDAPLASRV